MKNKVLLRIVILLVILSLMPLNCIAAGEKSASHYHPVCGTACSCAESHAGQIWLPLPTGTTTLTSGNYYLETSINFTGTNQLVIEGDVSICLNGYSILKNGSSTVLQIKSGTLTLSDCVGTGKVSVTASDKTSFGGGGALSNYGSLIMYGGTVNSDALGAAIYCSTTGDLSIYGGKVTGYYEAIDIYKVNDVTISAGTFAGTNGSAMIAGETYVQGTFRNITITGGYFEGKYNGISFGKFTCSGKVSISGGEFYGKGPVPNATTYAYQYYGLAFGNSGGGACNLSISGGTFRGARGGFYNFNPLLNATISDGTFYASKEDAISIDGGALLINNGQIHGISSSGGYNESTTIVVNGGQILSILINSSSYGISTLEVYGGTIGRVGATTSTVGLVSTLMNPTYATLIEIYGGTITGTEYAVRTVNPKTSLLISGGTFTGSKADIYLGTYGTTASNAPISMKDYTASAITVKLSTSIAANAYIAKNVSGSSLISLVDTNLTATYDSANKAVYTVSHTYNAVVTAPTCTQAGYTTYTCSDCGDSYITNEVAALGHKVMIDFSVAATCTETGLTEGEHCEQCNKVLVAQAVIPATGHDFTEGNCKNCGLVPAVMLGGNGYATLGEALAQAQSGVTVSLQADVTDADVILPGGVNLDLNGYCLTVSSVLTYSSGAIIDTSEDVSGLLKITDPDGNMISVDNAQLPVYDSANGGYRFFAIDVETRAVTGGSKYWFKVKTEKFAPLYELIQADADVQIEAKLICDGQTEDVYAAADLSFTKSWADSYNANKDVYITVSAAEADGLENFKLIPIITSGGVEISGDEM